MASGILTGRLPDGTAGPVAVDANGVLSTSVGSAALLSAVQALPHAPNVFKPFAATTITNETTVWTPASGKKFNLMGCVLTQSVATGDVTLRDGTAGTTIMVIPANTVGQAVPFSFGNGIPSATANNVLTAQGASTEKIAGYLFGTEV